MDQLYEIPRSRLLPTLVIFVFILGTLYTLFLVFQRFSLNGDIKALTAQTLDVENKIGALRAEDFEELFVAQELRERVENLSIKWSKVVHDLQSTVPVSVFLSSYSTSQDGLVQLSGLSDGYGSISDLISALQKSSRFTEVFVPSITLGTTSDGQDVLSFSLKLQYLP